MGEGQGLEGREEAAQAVEVGDAGRAGEVGEAEVGEGGEILFVLVWWLLGEAAVRAEPGWGKGEGGGRVREGGEGGGEAEGRGVPTAVIPMGLLRRWRFLCAAAATARGLRVGDCRCHVAAHALVVGSGCAVQKEERRRREEEDLLSCCSYKGHGSALAWPVQGDREGK